MNPRSINAQAAIIRDEASRQTDPIRREAMEIAATNLEKMATAIPAIKAVLAIYGAFPGAELSDIRSTERMAEEMGL